MAAGGHLFKGVEQVHLAPPQSSLSTKVNKHEWFPQGTHTQKKSGNGSIQPDFGQL